MEQNNHSVPEYFSSDKYCNGIPSLDANLKNEILSEETSDESDPSRDDRFDNLMIPPPTLL